MRRFLELIRKAFALIRREQMFKVLAIVILVTFAGSLGFIFFEKDIQFPDALWWSIVTLTTVGYGDISPSSAGGRMVGITIMVAGIGFLGILTANIASILVERRFLENKGMKGTHVKDHIIICGWNFRGHKIVEELRADTKYKTAPLVILADIPEKPMDDPDLYFINGEVEPETLHKANIDQARTVIVLSDDKLDAYAKDAKTVLNTLTIESVNPDVYTCVELMDEKNVQHCQRAHADEIIVVGELSTNLLVQAALDHGITRMISELVSTRFGEDLYKIKLPPRFVGHSFFEAMCELKESHEVLCLGIADKTGKEFIANPGKNHRLDEGDQLIVVADERPNLT